MKRKALIIGSSPDNDPLWGVKRDVDSWKNYLVSIAGGAWDESSELEVLEEPTVDELLKAKAAMEGADFGLIVFIGHGYVEDDSMGNPETFFILNDDEVISERKVNPRTPWFLSVMDCCRKYEQIEESVQIKKSASLEDAAAAVLARSLYELAISQAEKGWVKMYAADLGQSASDDVSFSHILIQESVKWSERHAGVLDTKTAFDFVFKRFEQINPQQQPVHRAGRRNRHFPFAIGSR